MTNQFIRHAQCNGGVWPNGHQVILMSVPPTWFPTCVESIFKARGVSNELV